MVMFRVEALSWTRFGYFRNSVPKTSTSQRDYVFGSFTQTFMLKTGSKKSSRGGLVC